LKPLRIGLSTCPNDTFAFHHLMERGGLMEREGQREREPLGGFGPVEWFLDDVQALNERARAGDLDIFKLSFAAALRLVDDVVLLPVGAALGFGVGPVVLARSNDVVLARSKDVVLDENTRVLAPGEDTTAHLLWRMFHPRCTNIEQRVFSAILPALLRGEADVGVCIHEARFTYRAHGLALVSDLGTAWEHTSGLPLPLGGLGVRRELVRNEPERVLSFARALRASIVAAREQPELCLPTMRRHAQEQSDDVLMQHAHTYVNERTVELGLEGRAALHELWRRAYDTGFTIGFTRSPRPCDVLDVP